MISTLLLTSVLNSTLIFSGQAIDAASTTVALNRCSNCYESNPLMKNQTVMYTSKVGVALLGIVVANSLEKSGHKNFARILSISFFIAPSIIAIHNLKVSNPRVAK